MTWLGFSNFLYNMVFLTNVLGGLGNTIGNGQCFEVILSLLRYLCIPRNFWWKPIFLWLQKLKYSWNIQSINKILRCKRNKTKGTLVHERGLEIGLLSGAELKLGLGCRTIDLAFCHMALNLSIYQESHCFNLKTWCRVKSWVLSRCLVQSPELNSSLRCSVQASVWGPGACFMAYDFILSQEAWLGLKHKCYKKLVKKFSLTLLLTTWSLDLKLSALKNDFI